MLYIYIIIYISLILIYNRLEILVRTASDVHCLPSHKHPRDGSSTTLSTEWPIDNKMFPRIFCQINRTTSHDLINDEQWLKFTHYMPHLEFAWHLVSKSIVDSGSWDSFWIRGHHKEVLNLTRPSCGTFLNDDISVRHLHDGCYPSVIDIYGTYISVHNDRTVYQTLRKRRKNV